MKIEALVHFLADGEFHSGEDIGRHFGISRTAVWKQLQKLADFGLSVESVKGKGYRLSQGIEFLRKDLVERDLTDLALNAISSMEILFDAVSTNQYALEQLAASKAGKGYICMAEYQYQGRGRRGRQWVSPLGANLCLSLVWEFEEGAAALEGLSLVVGIAVARALEALGLEGVALKWPNDILFDDAKLGGILLEMTGDPAGRCQVVIGIGVNVFMVLEPSVVDQPWIALSQMLTAVSRNRVAAAIVNALVPLLQSYTMTGFSPYVEEWGRYDAYCNRSVCLSAGERQTVGVAQGVADNGALLLDVNGAEQRVYGGELSLRPYENS